MIYYFIKGNAVFFLYKHFDKLGGAIFRYMAFLS